MPSASIQWRFAVQSLMSRLVCFIESIMKFLVPDNEVAAFTNVALFLELHRIKLDIFEI